MREKLYTIPLNDAVAANDECPFCFMERKLEQDLLDFVLGNSSSYMESDVREEMDQTGFCRSHFKKMFDYGNTLGNAWILKTHYEKTINQLEQQIKEYKPVKMGFFDKKRIFAERVNAIGRWTEQQEHSCYICNRFNQEFPRYMDTFLILYQTDDIFKHKVLNGNGFCLVHFGDLCEYAELHLKEKQKSDFFLPMFQMMKENMNRLQEDINWMIEKFDYRNKDADWKNSKDAIQRGMQKLKGGYPADPIYQRKK